MAGVNPTPPHIVHYLPHIYFARGGVVKAVLDCCKVLAARGNSVTLATFDAPDVPAGWDGSPGTPRVMHLSAARATGFLPKKALDQWRSLTEPLERHRGVVVHLHTPWLLSNTQIARSCRNRGIPYVVSIHGMLDDWSMAQKSLKKRAFLRLGGFCFLRRASSLHYSALAERDQAQRWVQHPHPVVLPNILDLSPFQTLPGPQLARDRFGLEKDIPVVLFLSRLHEKKGVHLLIEAARLLRSRDCSFRLLIAGPAAPADSRYEKGLHDAVERLGLGARVRFLGMVKGDEKVSLYQAANLFVLPTLQENFGIVLIEAMCAGTPVLTTRGTDIWKEIESAGARICEADPAVIATAISKLLGDPPALAEVGAQLRSWATRRFDAQVLGGEYEKIYSNIASR
jgi:glycosyltransferase involved in cell wall biosynthesis